jgi:hypothetical protein
MIYSHSEKNVLTGIKNKEMSRFLYVILLFLTFGCTSQEPNDTVPTWEKVAQGVYLMEMNAPIKSILGDSKLTIIRLQKDSIQAYLKMATAFDSVSKTVKEWADTFDFQLSINAGMYDLARPLVSKGFMKSDTFINNNGINPSYNGVCFIQNQRIDLSDLMCETNFQLTKQQACFQGMRLLDCQGAEMDWKRKKQSCSMLVMGEDNQNHLYIIFTRSPYYHQDMVDFLKKMPFKLGLTMYLEGGPETSVYLDAPTKKLELVGSYVSNTYPTDKNDHFWPLPNVLGFKFNR